MADVFDEHLSVISALRDNYARKEDVNAVAAVGSMQAEIAQLCSGREEDVKQAIRGEWPRRLRLAPAVGAPRRAGPPLPSPPSSSPCLPPPASPPPADLTRQVQETEIRASYPEGEVPHRVCVERLTEATSAARESVAAMNDTLQQLHAQRQALKERFRELRQKSAHIEQIVTEAEPHTRCAPAWAGWGAGACSLRAAVAPRSGEVTPCCCR